MNEETISKDKLYLLMKLFKEYRSLIKTEDVHSVKKRFVIKTQVKVLDILLSKGVDKWIDEVKHEIDVINIVNGQGEADEI